jgi:hypothetical protein
MVIIIAVLVISCDVLRFYGGILENTRPFWSLDLIAIILAGFHAFHGVGYSLE